MTDFQGVVTTLAQALNSRGYASLTPVQEAVLAPELKDVDALVSAQTGSGKTVAFGLNLAPTLLGDAERFARPDKPLALIIAPTRELALQVKREFEWLYEMTGAKIASCVGGMDMRTERNNLARGAHIVVGTPGRLRDHIERGSFDTSALRAVVLDEADEMLDLGFREELECILDTTPEDRRTLMFSATVPRGISNLAKRYQRDAVRVKTTQEEKQHVDIDYRALTVAPNDRENAIINVLRYYDAKNTIIFCGTRATVNHMTSRLTNRGFSVVALSGELSQNERSHALQAMRDGRARVCVATDVAARGIDLPGLELVIHADIPRNSETMLHRSGRTGRAGSKGVSALIVPFNQRRKTERLFSFAKIEAEWAKPPSVDEVLNKDRERFLANPAFSEPVKEDEQEFVQELLEKFNPEQIAASLIRIHNTNLPAPEELLDRPEPREREKREPRADFENGVWFSMSVGRKHNAEPRWILPMLCRAGHITKTDIGRIKIQQEETFVELTQESVEKFQEAIGPSRKIEKNVTIDRLEGTPEFSNDTRGDRRPRNRKSFDGDRPNRDRKPRRDGERKSHRKGKSDFKPDGDKPRSKKSYKPKTDKASVKKRGNDTAGMSPMKRKRKAPKK